MTKAIRMMEENLRLVDALIYVIDSRAVYSSNNPLFDKLIAGKKVLYVFNKCDLWTGEIRPHGENIVSISAKTGEGIDRLLVAIGERLDTGAKRVTIHLPYDQGGVLDTLYRESKVERVDYTDTIDVVAVCTPKTIGRLGPLVEGWKPHKEDWED